MWNQLRTLINNIFCKKVIYLISDTHFDHENIIRYCHRPFNSKYEMNKCLIENWNNTVNKNDVVYFLGDWGYGKGHRPISYWKRQLNGKIISIQGINSKGHPHDKYGLRHKIIKYKKHTFLLVHDPNNALKWKGWVIHGHTHNNAMDKYPFINGNRKTINVSVELTDYKPISLEALESLNIDSIKWMRTSNNIPERW